MLNTHIAQRKCAIPHSPMKNNRIMTCVLVTALCNQPEAYASDLGDNQSCYLCYVMSSCIYLQNTSLCLVDKYGLTYFILVNLEYTAEAVPVLR